MGSRQGHYAGGLQCKEFRSEDTTRGVCRRFIMEVKIVQVVIKREGWADTTLAGRTTFFRVI